MPHVAGGWSPKWGEGRGQEAERKRSARDERSIISTSWEPTLSLIPSPGLSPSRPGGCFAGAGGCWRPLIGFRCAAPAWKPVGVGGGDEKPTNKVMGRGREGRRLRSPCPRLWLIPLGRRPPLLCRSLHRSARRPIGAAAAGRPRSPGSAPGPQPPATAGGALCPCPSGSDSRAPLAPGGEPSVARAAWSEQGGLGPVAAGAGEWLTWAGGMESPRASRTHFSFCFWQLSSLLLWERESQMPFLDFLFKTQLLGDW